jgi:hypothetical protein
MRDLRIQFYADTSKTTPGTCTLRRANSRVRMYHGKILPLAQPYWINYPYRVVYVRIIGTHAQCDRIDAQRI